MDSIRWADAPLVAVDLEGTGGQDRENEAILEIGIVPIVAGVPDMAAAWESTINPGRRVPHRKWISPGLAGDALAESPSLDQLRSAIVDRLQGRVLVGHNVGVDARLLQLRLPEIRPALLLDTARLFKRLHPNDRRWNLIRALEKYRLNQRVVDLVPSGRPHRAMWDAAGAAVLLQALVEALPTGPDSTLTDLAQPIPMQATEDQAALF